MKEDIKIPWIEAGYRIFAYEGPKGLRIERLAQTVGKNKSSFYHLFADLEVFGNFLLAHHEAQAMEMVDKEAKATTQAHLVDILVHHKIDLLFNRQLRIHRENEDYQRTFEKINALAGPAIMGVWMKILGLEDNSYLAGLVYRLSLENFFLQITDETLNPDWLDNYFLELKALIKAFKSRVPVERLDGSV